MLNPVKSADAGSRCYPQRPIIHGFQNKKAGRCSVRLTHQPFLALGYITCCFLLGVASQANLAAAIAANQTQEGRIAAMWIMAGSAFHGWFSRGITSRHVSTGVQREVLAVVWAVIGFNVPTWLAAESRVRNRASA